MVGGNPRAEVGGCCSKYSQNLLNYFFILPFFLFFSFVAHCLPFCLFQVSQIRSWQELNLVYDNGSYRSIVLPFDSILFSDRLNTRTVAGRQLFLLCRNV